jgi:hypothetical protein
MGRGLRPVLAKAVREKPQAAETAAPRAAAMISPSRSPICSTVAELAASEATSSLRE